MASHAIKRNVLLLLASFAWLVPSYASASLIGDQVSVYLKLFDNPVSVVINNETVIVGAGPEFDRTDDRYDQDGVNDLLRIVLDLGGDGFSLSMECLSPIVDGCQLSSFELRFADLDWSGDPATLTGVDLVFGGAFDSSGDNLQTTSETVTPNSYSATFTESSLGTGGADSGTVTGTFRITRAVPEPAAYLLVFMGLTILLTRHRLIQLRAVRVRRY